MRLRNALVSLAAAALMLSGCWDNRSSDKTGLILTGLSEGKPTGSLILNLSYSNSGTSNSMSTSVLPGINTILPPTNMAPAAYDIQGTGPYGATFSFNNVTQNSLAVNSLPAGAWAVSVIARNMSGVAIASGSVAVAVAANQTAQADVTVRPLSGTGSFVLSLSWPANTVNIPAVTGVLTSHSGVQTPLTITMSPDNLSASYANSSLAAGYYTLSMKISDGGHLVWGRMESVRIVSGDTTAGTIALTAADLNPANEGNIAIIVDPEMNNPVTITFTGQSASLAQGTDMTVAAAISDTVDTYQWYLNGDPISGKTAASITIGSALIPGNYRLDLVVTKGEVISANGFGFSVTMGGAGNNGVAQWAQTVTVGSSDSQFVSVTVAPDGSMYAVGYINGTGTYNFGNNVTATGTTPSLNAILVKYDSSGVAQWAQTPQIVTPGLCSSYFYGISVAQDGSVYVAGYLIGSAPLGFGNNVTAAGAFAGNNVVLVKYNSSGVAQWAQTVAAGSNASQFMSVSAASDGSIYAAGYISGTGTYSFGNGITATGTYAGTPGYNVVLVKYNSFGVAQWAQTVTAGSNASQFRNISVASDGSIYAAGAIAGVSAYNFGNSVTAAGTYNSGTLPNLVLVKYSSSGVAQWARSLTTGSGPSQFNNVLVAPDSSVYAEGYISGISTFNFGNGVAAAGTATASNAVLVKYNSSGEAQWAQTVTAGSSTSSLVGLSIASDGSLYAGGIIFGTGTYNFGNGVTAAGTSSTFNILLIKYNGSGVAQWAKTVTAGPVASFFISVSGASDGSVYAAGYMVGTGTYGFGNNITAAGTNSSGQGYNAVLVKYR